MNCKLLIETETYINEQTLYMISLKIKKKCEIVMLRSFIMCCNNDELNAMWKEFDSFNKSSLRLQIN